MTANKTVERVHTWWRWSRYGFVVRTVEACRT